MPNVHRIIINAATVSARSSRPTRFAPPPIFNFATPNLTVMALPSTVRQGKRCPKERLASMVERVRLVSATPPVRRITLTASAMIHVASVAKKWSSRAMPLESSQSARPQTCTCSMDYRASSMRRLLESAWTAGALPSRRTFFPTMTLTFPPNRPVIIWTQVKTPPPTF